jgi:hypothetical protein
MTYFEDEILHELHVGELYTQRQIAIFLAENKDNIVISKSCKYFQKWSTNKHKVLQIIEGYEHRCNNDRTYHIPDILSKFIILD